MLGELLVDLIDRLVGLVAGLGRFLATQVVVGVCLSVLDHLVDVIVGQRRAARDRHLLGLAGSKVLR